MKNEQNLKILKENLEQHKNLKLYYKNEFFDSFTYDKENKKYQSNSGYLTIQKVYEISKGLELDRKIVWVY